MLFHGSVPFTTLPPQLIHQRMSTPSPFERVGATNDGTIRVDSVLGRGTAFVIHICFARARARGDGEAAAPAAACDAAELDAVGPDAATHEAAVPDAGTPTAAVRGALTAPAPVSARASLPSSAPPVDEARPSRPTST